MIYFDNAATRRVPDDILKKIIPYFTTEYGNASAIYDLGRNAKRAIDSSREIIAKAINTDPSEIYFTSSGTESDNWVIKGIASANKEEGKHIVVSAIEHHAILEPCKYLQKNGFDISYIPVDSSGIVNVKDIEKLLRNDTILISVMFANNEIGTIQPIAQIADLAKKNGIYFHTDAVQAVGHVDIDVKKLGVDLLTISGHKLGGPKGVGALYIKKGVKIDSLLHGGAQEMGRRASTENTPSIVGLGLAVQNSVKNMKKNNEYVNKLRDMATERILSSIPDCFVNGDLVNRLPGNVNVCFKYIEGESILLHLNQAGISASSGSACASASLEASHVLLTIGVKPEEAHGSLRLSFSEDNTVEEVEYLLDVLPKIVSKLRAMSPLYNSFKKK